MSKQLCSIALMGLIGCSTNNKVETLIPEQAVVKHVDIAGYTDRYSNLYGKLGQYPYTCKEDCYPNT